MNTNKRRELADSKCERRSECETAVSRKWISNLRRVDPWSFDAYSYLIRMKIVSNELVMLYLAQQRTLKLVKPLLKAGDLEGFWSSHKR